MDLQGVAVEGLRAFRQMETSLGSQDTIARWTAATGSFCAEPLVGDCAEWFRNLARDVFDFPQKAVAAVLQFQWYRTFGDRAILLAYGEFILALSAACSSQVLNIVDTLVSFLSTPHQFPTGNKITVGDRTFDSPHALKQFCRTLLYNYLNDNDKEHKMVNDEDATLLRAVLEHHPRAKEKTANGVEAIGVGKHPSYPHNCFFFRNSAGEWEDFSYRRCAENIKTPNCLTQAHICEIIGEILRLCPSTTLATAKMLEDRMPHWQSKITKITDHRNYMQALLYLAESCVLTDPLLRLLLRRLGDLDVEVAYATDSMSWCRASDLEADEESLDFAAQLLDALMGVVFEFLQSRLARRTDITKTEASRIARLTIAVFEEVTFMVHRSRHVQFIYFYICSLNSEWTEEFLIRLLRILYNEGENIEKRRQSLNYLSSMVVRAKFLSTKYTLQTTRYLIEWLNEQLVEIESRSPYSVVGEGWDPKWLMYHQSVEVVIYILCWKAEEFHRTGESIGHLWNGTEGDRSPLEVLFMGPELDHSETAPKCRFADVLMSRLRPIDRICPDMLQRFVCRMDKVVGSEGWWSRLRPLVNAGQEQITDMVFAFEPYRLRNSHAFVKNIYRCWDEVEIRGPAVQGFESERRDLNDASGSASSRASGSACGDMNDAHMIASPSPSFCPRKDEFSMSPFSLDSTEPPDMLSMLLESSAYLSSQNVSAYRTQPVGLGGS